MPTVNSIDIGDCYLCHPTNWLPISPSGHPFLPFFWRLFRMEYCKNEYEIVLIVVQHTMWERFKWPAANFGFKDLHRERPSGGSLYSGLNCGLKPTRQLRIDLSVVGLLSPNVFTRGLKKLYGLQRSSARSSE